MAELGRAIARAGLSAADFYADNNFENFYAGYSPVPALFHRPTGAWFGFAEHRDHPRRAFQPFGYHLGMRPGRESQFEDRHEQTWADLLRVFEDWLSYVKREAAAQDFIAAFDAELTGITSADAELDAQPFSAPEQSAVMEKLEAIEDTLADSVQPNREFERFVREEFAALRSELRSMQRGKWRRLFVGSVVGLMLRGVVSSDAVQQAIRAAQDFWINTILPSIPRLGQ